MLGATARTTSASLTVSVDLYCQRGALFLEAGPCRLAPAALACCAPRLPWLLRPQSRGLPHAKLSQAASQSALLGRPQARASFSLFHSAPPPVVGVGDLADSGNKLVDAQVAAEQAKNDFAECQQDLKALQTDCNDCTKTIGTGR